MKKIIFVFKEGRANRLQIESRGPKEFFYTYDKFKKNNNSVDFIESNENSKSILKLIFKLFRKASDLPIYTENFTELASLKKLFQSRIIIATNQNLAFSLLPILAVKNIFFNIELYTFAMGFIETIKSKKLNKIFVNLFLKISTKIIFISKNEYEEAINQFPKNKNKFVYIPFCIDTKFWNTDKNLNNEKNILFIGNDSNRDYEFVIQLAKKMPEYNFVLISERINYLELPNVKLIRGNWNKVTLTDIEIKEYYSNAFLTILPIKETFQPSGQSVALQSISMNTPVLITVTDGFWDCDNFKDNENIFFIEKNNIDKWKNRIEEISKDTNLYLNVSKNGKYLVDSDFNLDLMYLKVSELINDS